MSVNHALSSSLSNYITQPTILRKKINNFYRHLPHLYVHKSKCFIDLARVRAYFDTSIYAYVCLHACISVDNFHYLPPGIEYVY